MDGERKSVPTLADVALMAGVSKITASRALRDQKPMKEKTRQRVLDAAKKLGYRPNPLIQTLMSGVRKQQLVRSVGIAWVHAYTSNDPRPTVVSSILDGARLRASELGYDLYDFPLIDPELTTPRVRQILEARGIGAAVFSPLPKVGIELPFPWAELPMSKVGNSIAAPLIHNCGVHHRHQMELILKKITERGYQKVGYLSLAQLDLRFEHSCMMVITYYQTQIPIKNRIPTQTVDAWKPSDFRNWFEKYQPEVVIADLPDIMEQLKASKAKGVKEAPHVIFSLQPDNMSSTGVFHPFPALGSAAIDLVIAQMHRNERGIPQRPKTLLIEGDWHEGTSLPPLKKRSGSKTTTGKKSAVNR